AKTSPSSPRPAPLAALRAPGPRRRLQGKAQDDAQPAIREVALDRARKLALQADLDQARPEALGLGHRLRYLEPLHPVENHVRRRALPDPPDDLQPAAAFGKPAVFHGI